MKKKFAMLAIDGTSIIPQTCLCEDHNDKRDVIQAPDNLKHEWGECTDPSVKCIWCGYKGPSSAVE